ncbi:MAG: GDSL family lipase [Hyphomicrobiales bacterium]|nr:GDSL family lipase [Hyphomicrobiales bacterium]
MPSWFDDEVSALEKRTAPRRHQDNLVLCYGSSTFTLWDDMEAHFPGYNVVNHGFGGSTLEDCLEYFDRLVTPLNPRAVVLYAGDNDLDNGASPEKVLDMIETFIALKRDALGPDIPLAFVSIKVSRAREHFMHKIGYTNRIAERRLADEPDVTYVDFTRRLVGRGYAPWAECFTYDPLHMNEEGYRVLGKTIWEYLDRLDRETGSLKVRDTGVAPAWMAPAGCANADGTTPSPLSGE